MFNPMLSGKVLSDLSNVRLPVYASLKLDGIRCIIQNGMAVSRTLKPIPNQYVQQCLKGLPDGLDGELIVGNPNHPDVFNITQSGIMSVEGMPEFKFWVFDYCNEKLYAKEPFSMRFSYLDIVARNPCIILKHYKFDNMEKLLQFEEWAVSNGFEGIMVRDPNGPYKFGRSTDKQGWLLKMKRFHDSEATIIGFEELRKNENEQETDERGYSTRSKKAEGMAPANTLGALLCKLDNGIEFSCGSGFNDSLRIMVWKDRDHYLNKRIKFKYQNFTADKKPRMPIFLGFRMD